MTLLEEWSLDQNTRLIITGIFIAVILSKRLFFSKKGEKERSSEKMKKWFLLANVTTEIEADIVIALLEQEEIPARKAFPGIGNLKGTYGLINGVEIYVPEDCIKQAKEILNADREITIVEDPE